MSDRVEKYYEIPVIMRVKATGPDAESIVREIHATDYEEFDPAAFPLNRDGVRIEILTYTFPDDGEMIETEEDPY